jgi:hypothetical protein
VLLAVADALAASDRDKGGRSYRAEAYRKLAGRVQQFPGKLSRANELNRPRGLDDLDDDDDDADDDDDDEHPESPKENSAAGSSVGNGYKRSQGSGDGNRSGFGRGLRVGASGGGGAQLSAKMLDRLDVVLRGETRVAVVLEHANAGGASGVSLGSSSSSSNSSSLPQSLAAAQRAAVHALSCVWGVGDATAAKLVVRSRRRLWLLPPLLRLLFVFSYSLARSLSLSLSLSLSFCIPFLPRTRAPPSPPPVGAQH